MKRVIALILSICMILSCATYAFSTSLDSHDYITKEEANNVPGAVILDHGEALYILNSNRQMHRLTDGDIVEYGKEVYIPISNPSYTDDSNLQSIYEEIKIAFTAKQVGNLTITNINITSGNDYIDDIVIKTVFLKNAEDENDEFIDTEVINRNGYFLTIKTKGQALEPTVVSGSFIVGGETGCGTGVRTVENQTINFYFTLYYQEEIVSTTNKEFEQRSVTARDAKTVLYCATEDVDYATISLNGDVTMIFNMKAGEKEPIYFSSVEDEALVAVNPDAAMMFFKFNGPFYNSGDVEISIKPIDTRTDNYLYIHNTLDDSWKDLTINYNKTSEKFEFALSATDMSSIDQYVVMDLPIQFETQEYDGAGENLKWKVDSDGILRIYGSGDMYNFTPDKKAPWDKYSSIIDKVVIDDGVNSIGDFAFQRLNTRFFEIGKDVSKISECAFGTVIPLWALNKNGKKYYYKSFEEVVENYTDGCSVSQLMYTDANNYNKSILNIDVDKNNNYFKSIDGVLFSSNNELIKYPNAKAIQEIPENTESIASNAFLGNSFSSIVIPDNVVKIDDYAFSNNFNIEKITIPKNVSYLGKNFTNDYIKVNIADENNFYKSCDSNDGNATLILSKDGKHLYDSLIQDYQQTIEIPNTVEIIDKMAFFNSEIEEIIFPNNLVTICDLAFYNSGIVTATSIPNSLKYVGNMAFFGCYFLESFDTPNSTTIGFDAFGECWQLIVNQQQGEKPNNYLAGFNFDKAYTLGMSNGIMRLLEKEEGVNCVFPDTTIYYPLLDKFGNFITDTNFYNNVKLTYEIETGQSNIKSISICKINCSVYSGTNKIYPNDDYAFIAVDLKSNDINSQYISGIITLTGITNKFYILKDESIHFDLKIKEYVKNIVSSENKEFTIINVAINEGEPQIYKSKEVVDDVYFKFNNDVTMAMDFDSQESLLVNFDTIDNANIVNANPDAVLMFFNFVFKDSIQGNTMNFSIKPIDAESTENYLYMLQKNGTLKNISSTYNDDLDVFNFSISSTDDKWLPRFIVSDIPLVDRIYANIDEWWDYLPNESKITDLQITNNNSDRYSYSYKDGGLTVTLKKLTEESLKNMHDNGHLLFHDTLRFRNGLSYKFQVTNTNSKIDGVYFYSLDELNYIKNSKTDNFFFGENEGEKYNNVCHGSVLTDRFEFRLNQDGSISISTTDENNHYSLDTPTCFYLCYCIETTEGNNTKDEFKYLRIIVNNENNKETVTFMPEHNFMYYSGGKNFHDKRCFYCRIENETEEQHIFENDRCTVCGYYNVSATDFSYTVKDFSYSSGDKIFYGLNDMELHAKAVGDCSGILSVTDTAINKYLDEFPDADMYFVNFEGNLDNLSDITLIFYPADYAIEGHENYVYKYKDGKIKLLASHNDGYNARGDLEITLTDSKFETATYIISDKNLHPTHNYDYKVTSTEYLCTSATCTEPATYYYSCECEEKGTTTFTDGLPLGHDLVHHDYISPTCLTTGSDAYDTCSRCDYTTYVEIPALGHDPLSEYSSDTDSHWYACSRCGEKLSQTDHTFITKSDDTNHWLECSTCGHVKDLASHNYTTKTDALNHWLECSCGYITNTNLHTYDSATDEECNICNYHRTLEILSTIHTTDASGKNVYTVSGEKTDSELSNGIDLTSVMNNLAAVISDTNDVGSLQISTSQGALISFDTLAIQTISSNTNNSTVFKMDVDTSTNNKITINFELPQFTKDNAKGKATISYPVSVPSGKQVKVYYVHDGKRDAITCNVVNGNVVFTLGHFSSYEIAYEDKPTLPPSNNTGSTGGSRGGGGGGGGGASLKTITLPITKTGEEVLGVIATDVAGAKYGQKVTIIVTPTDGYVVEKIEVTTTAKGVTVIVSKTDENIYTFTMPNGNVEIKPTYVKAPEPVVEEVKAVEPEVPETPLETEPAVATEPISQPQQNLSFFERLSLMLNNLFANLFKRNK